MYLTLLSKMIRLHQLRHRERGMQGRSVAIHWIATPSTKARNDDFGLREDTP